MGRSDNDKQPADGNSSAPIERALDGLLEGCSLLGFDWTYLYVNEAAARQSYLPREKLIGRTVHEVFPTAGQTEFFRICRVAMEQRVTQRFEAFFTYSNGETCWFETSAEPVPDGIFLFTLDITRRKIAEQELQLAALVYQASSEAMLITDIGSTIISVNPAYTKITGYQPEEVIGKKSELFRSDRHDESFFTAIWREINETGHWQGEIWCRRKNGEEHPAWLTISTSWADDGSPKGYVVLFSDITQQKQSEELIWKQANFDALTNLPNRRMLLDRLQQEIRKAQRDDQPLALMFLDLDHFKEVNDTLGHDTGDILLKEAAQRLTSCVRESDTVGRTGGDEFTVILSGLDDPGCIDGIAEKILKKLAEPFPLGNDKVYVSTSIGITLFPNDADNIDTLFKNADQSMYAAKNLGRNRYCYFTPEMQEAAQRRMRLALDLREALAGNQFQLYYQPIVDMNSNVIRKAEALIRWQHPTRGWVSPADFIPIAEDTGMIIDIGDWVFREAVRQVKQWSETRNAPFQISVNASPMQFKRGRNAEWFDYLKEQGLSGQCISIEITEGLLLDASASVTAQLAAFSEAGMQVSLDDFGTGYSALSYLKKFDIDFLKIDQSFVRNLATDSDDMALCEAIILMAHKLGIQVVAEGVETIEQRDLLAAVGCDFAQGYLYSRPVPPADFEKLLASFEN